jgi:hypothetical protein
MIVKETINLQHPLSLDIKLATDELIDAARMSVPVGKHLHDRNIPYANFTPRKGGRLVAIVSNRANWKFKDRPPGMKARLTIKNHWGAAVLEFGANVAAVTKKWMSWRSDAGKSIAGWVRKGYHINPRPFSPEILRRFMAARIPGTGGSVVKVTWRNSKGQKGP